MSNTEFVYITGKLKWVRVQTPDPWNNWKVTVYPDNPSLDKIRELQAEGVKNVLKKDEDGYFVVFRRPASKTMKGKVVGFAPPEVLQKDGTPLRDVLVGNGSDGVVKLEVYSHNTPGGGKAKAARLLALRVDNLIPFTVDKDFDPDQQKAVKDLMEQPEQLF